MHTDPVRATGWLVVLVAALSLAGGASADGDPASDYLVARDTFTPYPPPSATALTALEDAVRAVGAKGDRVKVAVIGQKSDLGSVPSLYGHAQDYAKFLGVELSFIYKGPLLIVMPTGFGFVAGGLPVAAADAALARVSLDGSTTDGLTLTAARALPALQQAGALHYKDTFAPTAYPSPATVIAGRRLALRYQAWDDSGRAKVDLQIRNSRQIVVARFAIPLRAVSQGAWYRVVWRVPLKYARHALATCVQATDPAGNHSRLTCAKLSVT